MPFCSRVTVRSCGLWCPILAGGSLIGVMGALVACLLPSAAARLEGSQREASPLPSCPVGFVAPGCSNLPCPVPFSNTRAVYHCWSSNAITSHLSRCLPKIVTFFFCFLGFAQLFDAQSQRGAVWAAGLHHQCGQGSACPKVFGLFSAWLGFDSSGMPVFSWKEGLGASLCSAALQMSCGWIKAVPLVFQHSQ